MRLEPDETSVVHRLSVGEHFTLTLTLVLVWALQPILGTRLLTLLRPNYYSVPVQHCDLGLDFLGTTLQQVVLNVESDLLTDEFIWFSVNDMLHSFPVVFSLSHIDVSLHAAPVTHDIVGSVGPSATAALGVNVKIVDGFPL